MEFGRVCIVGCCRDIAKNVAETTKAAERILEWFRDGHIVFIENDSSDDTRPLLQQWAAVDKQRRSVIFEDDLVKKFRMRTHRLAYCRNRLLDAALQTPGARVPVPTASTGQTDGLTRFDKFDYMFMFDTDGLLTSKFKKDALNSCFQPTVVPENWTAIAGHTKRYYDIWALRVPDVIEFDCWEKFRSMRANTPGVTAEDATEECVNQYKRYMTRVEHTIPVFSAFNGAMLLKLSDVRECCRFNGVPNSGKGQICEHVPFQECLRSHGGCVYSNPQMVVE